MLLLLLPRLPLSLPLSQPFLCVHIFALSYNCKYSRKYLQISPGPAHIRSHSKTRISYTTRYMIDDETEMSWHIYKLLLLMAKRFKFKCLVDVNVDGLDKSHRTVALRLFSFCHYCQWDLFYVSVSDSPSLRMRSEFEFEQWTLVALLMAKCVFTKSSLISSSGESWNTLNRIESTHRRRRRWNGAYIVSFWSSGCGTRVDWMTFTICC